jgi:type-F conjugative transfer system pilin assembly protein TrbC
MTLGSSSALAGTGAEGAPLPGASEMAAVQAQIQAAMRDVDAELGHTELGDAIEQLRSRAAAIEDADERPVPLPDITGIGEGMLRGDVELPRQAVEAALPGAVGDVRHGQLYAFVSLGMPDNELLAIVAQARVYDAKVIIRGLYEDHFRATLARLNDLGIDRGIAIDPLAFRRFSVSVVPTYVLALETSPVLEQKPTPQHVKAAGSVSIPYFLELVERAEPGPVATEARRRLRAEKAHHGRAPETTPATVLEQPAGRPPNQPRSEGDSR